MSEITLLEAIRTQRAIRRFSARPVSDQAIATILKSAIRAPSPSNRQPWYFLVIRDPQAKRRLGEWFLDAWGSVYGGAATGDLPQPTRSGAILAQQMAEVPVLIIACVDRGARGPRPGPITLGASIYPAVQNLLLAARALGLGTVLTTMHRSHEEEIKRFLGIPDNVETAALIPVGYPAEGEHFGGSKRKPVSEVAFYDRWGQRRPT